MFAYLLPYLEQDALYRLGVSQGGFFNGGDGTAEYAVVVAFRCPADPVGNCCGVQDGIGGPTNWGVSNYAANYLAFGNPAAGNKAAAYGTTDGLRVQGSSTFPGSFPDGNSNTMLFTERYGNCTNDTVGGAVYTSLWADSSAYWRPVVCGADLTRSLETPGYPACAVFQVRPSWQRECDPTRGQSPHANGINVALADGSVRVVGGSISATTWAKVCDPRDGNVLSADW